MIKKILYVRTAYGMLGAIAGGLVGHTSGVINALRKRYEVKVIANENLPRVQGNIEVVKPVQTFINVKHIATIIDLNEFLYNFRIIKLIDLKEYDVLYHRYSGFSFSSAYLAYKNNIPFVLEYNGSELWMTKNWQYKSRFCKSIIKKIYHLFLKLPLMYVIEKYNFKKARLIVVVSKALQNELVTRGIEKKKILVNPNGVDIEQYSVNVDSREITKKYQLQNKIILGFIGSFGPWHGIKIIVLAYAKLLSQYSEYKEKSKLMLIGDGIQMPEVKQSINKLGISNHVILTGLVPQGDGPTYLGACDILINATVPNLDGSEFFGSPTKIFEYMAMGKAIISSDMAQMSEVLTHNKTAFMVKPNDSNALMMAMKYLIDDIKLRNKLGKNARKEAISKYSWDKHVEKILQHITKN